MGKTGDMAMSVHKGTIPFKIPFVTKGVTILLILSGIGILAYIYRIFTGLTVTNLDNQYPWGIWIAIDVATGVALAAGGFTTAALAHIFHRKKFEIIVRPALLTALLGYTFVVIGLLADLGKYYNVWHPIIPSMWQGNSVLFEVGICVMLYLSVLYIEFIPVVIDRFKGRVAFQGGLSAFNRFFERLLVTLDNTLGRFISVFIILGVVLSCLHQSSLGALMLIAPTKMHPLWYTNILPLLFLLSAIAVGFPVVILESLLTARSFRLKPELNVLSALARYIPFLLAVYLGVKVVDLTIRDAWPLLFAGSHQSLLFAAELILGVVLPIIFLSTDKIRKSAAGLMLSAALVIFGVVLNRIDVFLVAYNPPYAEKAYFPSIVEFAVTIGLISLLVIAFRALAMVFPVIPQIEHKKTESILSEKQSPVEIEG